MRRFTRLYGAGPLHAALLLASFAVAGYVASRVLGVSHAGWIGVWVVGAIVAHDLVLFPLYAAADRLLSRRRGPGRGAAEPWRNHVRTPVIVSGTLLLITFPLVLRLSEPHYVSATGLHTSVYLGRWLAVTAAVFACSGVIYAARWTAHRGARRRTGAPIDSRDK